MAWKVRLEKTAEKAFDTLDRPIQKKIISALEEIRDSENPRDFLVPYSGPLAGYWKKRVGDYRIVCEIQDQIITVVVLEIGHRSKIYR